MSTAQPVVPDPDIDGYGGPCSLQASIVEGRYEIIHECRSEPGQFWTVVCDGTVDMTAPLFDYTGEQRVHGSSEIDRHQIIHQYLELHAMAAPGPSPRPPAGAAHAARLYLDAADGRVKILTTVWPEVSPGVWAEEPVVAVMTLQGIMDGTP